MLPKTLLSLLLVYTLLLGALPVTRAQIADDDSMQTNFSQDEDDATSDDSSTPERKGLQFRLSEGGGTTETGATPRTQPTPVNATMLSDAETEAVLRRLPPMKADANDEDFAMRDRSLPPPRTGNTINVEFPSKDERQPNRPNVDTTNTVAALEVLRVAPEGEVTLAPEINITFSQPMVAVTSQDELAAQDVPARLTPNVAGKWRWMGTRTLAFVPQNRLPMATNYTVTIPAGTRSANGGALAATKTFTFATPPPVVKSTYPSGSSIRRDAIMFVEFDQAIDANAVLARITARAASQNLKLRLATVDEIKSDRVLANITKRATQGRWLAFRAVDASNVVAQLPSATEINITVNAGTPSAEGSRVTTKPQAFTFQTYGALKITGTECGYQKRCSPFDAFQISFSNSLDAEAFDESQVQITPEIKAKSVSVSGNQIFINGAKRGRTQYRVTVSGNLKDEFGQTLGAAQTVTFNVGSADPSLSGVGEEGFVVLDPNAAATFSVVSVNYRQLKASIYQVAPEDYANFRRYMRGVYGYDESDKTLPRTPPGRLIQSKTIDVANKSDEIVETRIDLAPALKTDEASDAKVGQMIVIVEPVGAATGQPAKRRRGYRRVENFVAAWVQRTNIGLDAFVDGQKLVAWATAIKDGAPLANTELTLLPTNVVERSGADGLARLALPEAQTKTANVLVARRGADVAILPQDFYWWNDAGQWRKVSQADELRWYVFDDRKMYRPKETVNIKGYLRRVGQGLGGDVGSLQRTATSVSYTVADQQGNEVAKGSAAVNALGGFNLTVKLPDTMNLGYANVNFVAEEASVTNTTHAHQFQVQEFRRPEFEVSAQTSDGVHIVGGFAEATVKASYYAGGALTNTDASWTVTSVPTNYTPPNCGDFTFGKWYPWWRTYDGNNYTETRTETYKGKTDAEGKHRLRMDFDAVSPARPSSVTARVVVQDVNRQTLQAQTSLLVHPSSLYVGLRSARTFVQKGETLEVESIVSDIDGKLIAGVDVRMRAVRLEWKFEKGEWRQKEADAQDCNVRSTSAPVKCNFKTVEGGTYTVTARVLDDRERVNESELTLWVAGGKLPPKRDVEQETVELIPDRKEYKAGEVAQILVNAPFVPAEGVLTLRRSGLVRTERFVMREPSLTLRVPIEDGFTPNVHVQVDLVGASARVDEKGEVNDRLPKRPAYASGAVNLSVPPMERKLEVKAVPREGKLEPGTQTQVQVEVKDAGGRAVSGAELAVVVVDESVLALSNYRLTDPLAVFYQQRGDGVGDHHLRERVLLENPELLFSIGGGEGSGMGSGRGGGGGGSDYNRVFAPSPTAAPRARREARSGQFQIDGASGAENSVVIDGQEVTNFRSGMLNGNNEQTEIRARLNFDSLAVFAPAVPTDANGRATVQVKIPDNLTRYRVMAVAVSGAKQFGMTESNITARLPLMVRPSAPRFLNFGDKFELPVVVQNQTDEPMTVNVAVRAANVRLTDGAGRRVTIPANDRAEIRFPAETNRAGTARFQVGAVANDKSDAAEINLPVWTPATTEAFATYGTIDNNTAMIQPVLAPRNVFSQFGGLEVTTSSTQMQELTDAFLYIVSYPYECSEQLSSRILSVAALRDVLTAFKAKDLPTPDEINAAVVRDIKRLEGRQREDGSFGFWRRDDKTYPYVNVHVAHALVRAKEKGYNVPEQMLERSQNYLKNVESKIPSDYSPEAKRAIAAYALYVRMKMNDRDAAKARRLLAEAKVDSAPLEMLGWLLPVLSGDAQSTVQVEQIRRRFNNSVSETAATAHFTTSYSDGDLTMLHSERRTDGIILEALIGDQPQSEMITKIVRGLLESRTRGRWENTQDNVFILLALDRYFNTYEKQTPDFVSRVWLGQTFAGEQTFKGRSTDRNQLNIPMRYLTGDTSGASNNSGNTNAANNNANTSNAANGNANSNQSVGDRTQNLAISKQGAGRLYYRVGMTYAPTNLQLKAADYGFAIDRSYEAVDDAGDVKRETDGTWRIKAGARVRVRVQMFTKTRRYHVALVDPLPAGLESLNPALATTEALPPDQNQNDGGISPLARGGGRYGWWWREHWFDHQNLRDERAEAFTALLWEGVYNYTYFARATTPGNFVVPPAKAEEMYHPETFGRGASDRVRVE